MLYTVRQMIVNEPDALREAVIVAKNMDDAIKKGKKLEKHGKCFWSTISVKEGGFEWDKEKYRVKG